MLQVQMSLEEKLKIGVQAVELRKQGKHEEAETLMRQIPLAPYLAKAAKETFGVDVLRQGGWDLSEANEEYGPNWLGK
ncbi:hypothetical protein LQZ19_15660 [Treponema primitia]|uniref:hypothetical protein n=1 Tax=Treponema primitia TaxID=88058 RepID=UPI00397F41C4